MSVDTDPLERLPLLVDVASAALIRTLRDGKEHGYRPGEWMEHGIMDHLDRAYAHTASADRLYQSRSVASPENLAELLEDIDHAITRLCFLRALLGIPQVIRVAEVFK